MGFISPVALDASGAQKATGSQQSLGKDDFLQLLVTKLQYQDPLKPMDDEDFIAQLASFSSLEQMNNISQGIANSNDLDMLQMQSMNNMLASGLIGNQVTADFSGVYWDEVSQPNIAYTLTDPAAEITFEIRNEYGELVTTISEKDADIGAGSIKWDGTDSLGNRAPEGYYTVSATATTTSGATFTPRLEITGEVTTITYRNGSAYVMVNGTEVSLGDIRSVGQAEED
jgi:flagellar basal-body rod modification protein FlgD